MAFVSAAIAIAGLAISAYEKHKQGAAAKAAGEHAQDASNSEADLADFNASVADDQAADARARGAEQENRFRAQVRGVIGAQRTGFAAAGVDVSYGSAVEVQADAAKLGELDALTIRTNARREALGFQNTAEDWRRRAQIARKEGDFQAAAGIEAQGAANWSAASTVLAGAGSLLESRYGFNRGGGGNGGGANTNAGAPASGYVAGSLQPVTGGTSFLGASSTYTPSVGNASFLR